MYDVDYIRKNSEFVKKVISSGRGKPDKANIDRWLELDEKRSKIIKNVEDLRAERNEINSKLTGKPDQETVEKMKSLKDQVETFEKELIEIEQEWKEILDWVPNIPVSEEAMPFGKGEEDNPVDKVWVHGKGYLFEKSEGKTVGTFDENIMPERSIHWDGNLTEPKHHIDIGEDLEIIDNKQSAKVSGSRFTYLIGDIVLLQYGIQQLMFEELLRRGFKPIIPPLLVKERTLYGTSHFPEGRDQVYQIKGDYVEDGHELFLVGSSEPTNFSYFMDRTLDKSQLPYKVFAFTPCFRSEVGSWGRDVKGIKRVHQFDKLEMNAVATPEQSSEVFAEFLSINEWLLQTLEISYRLARKCTGDAGYQASAEQIDPEAWLPGQKEFIEVGTDTNTTDFQSRRLNIKFKDEAGNSRYAHTINDTGVAMGRMLITIIDNYQQSNGSILVPKALQRFVGKDKIEKESV